MILHEIHEIAIMGMHYTFFFIAMVIFVTLLALYLNHRSI